MRVGVAERENIDKGSALSVLPALTASSSYVTWSGAVALFSVEAIQSCALQSVRADGREIRWGMLLARLLDESGPYEERHLFLFGVQSSHKFTFSSRVNEEDQS